MATLRQATAGRGASRSIMVLCGCLLAASCDERPSYWEAWISPGGDDERNAYRIVGFVDFETCKAASLEALERDNAIGTGYFECGYKCVPLDDFGGMHICEETRD